MIEDNGDPYNPASAAYIGQQAASNEEVPFTIQQEQLDWLRTLIGSYEEEHIFAEDEDPDATREMLMECRRLAKQLQAVAVPEEVESEGPAPIYDEKILPF